MDKIDFFESLILPAVKDAARGLPLQTVFVIIKAMAVGTAPEP